MKKNDINYFLKLASKKQAKILLNSPPSVRKHFLQQINPNNFKQIQKNLTQEETTDLLQNLNPKTKNKLIKTLSLEKQEFVKFYLKFYENNLNLFINHDFIKIDINEKSQTVINKIRNFEKQIKKEPIILVYEKDFFLGQLPMHKLLLDKTIKNNIKKVSKIDYDLDFDEAIQFVKKEKNDLFVVIDHKDNILGIMQSKDFLKHFDKELTRNFFQFAGVKTEENPQDNFLLKIKNRYLWLILNLFTAFLATLIITHFENTISKMVILAAYMPIITGMGGNAGTQTMAVVIRGLTLGEINIENSKKVILNEILAGIINGTITGLITAIIAYLLNSNIILGILVFTSMIINLIISGIFGTTIPIILDKLEIDPAKSSTIFITTATDIIGFLTFLGLAKILI